MIDLQEIISISGKPGLYQLLSQSKKGVIVRSLLDGKKMPAQITHKISTLEDITIYTDDEDMALGEVFQRIKDHEGGKPSIDHKSDKEELRNRFREIIPEFDEEQVYSSDIKKIFQWYNILQQADLLKEKTEEEGDQNDGTSEETTSSSEEQGEQKE